MKKNNEVLFFQYVTSFLNTYLKNQINRSLNTVESYRDSLTTFRKFLLSEKNLKIQKFTMSMCNKELILDYMDYLRGKNYKASTINHHLAAIRSYLWYVSDIDITYQGLAISIGHIPLVRQTKYDKEYLSQEALKMMFTAPTGVRAIRDRTIMILLYETAMRVSELIHIKLEDLFLNTENPYILITGKGDKERIVGLSTKALDHLNYYLKQYHNKNINTNILFYSFIKGNYGYLSESTIETFIQKYADIVRKMRVNIPLKVYPHMFRRTRATHLYQNNIPLELVGRILGHSSIETTKIYAKPSLNQLKQIIENENDICTEPEWNTEDEIAKLFGLR